MDSTNAENLSKSLDAGIGVCPGCHRVVEMIIPALLKVNHRFEIDEATIGNILKIIEVLGRQVEELKRKQG